MKYNTKQVKPVQYALSMTSNNILFLMKLTHTMDKHITRYSILPMDKHITRYSILLYTFWDLICNEDTTKLGLVLKTVSFTSYFNGKN